MQNSSVKPARVRMPEQDIAKGIAVLMVLALHTLTLKRSLYSVCGGLFGFILPFFFFIAGYNHRPGRWSYPQIIKRRAKQILVPFFIYSILITVIAGAYLMIAEHYSLEYVLQTYGTMLLTRPTSEMIGLKTVNYLSNQLYSCIMMFWFIQMLFSATVVFYAVADYSLKKPERLCSVLAGLIGLTMVFAHFDIHLPLYLCEAPSIAAIMLAGAAFGKRGLLARHAKPSVIVLNGIAAYAIFILLALLFRGSGFILGGSLWDDTLREWSVPLTFVFSVIGSYPFVHFCRCLLRTGPVGTFLGWCGVNSMKFMFLHGIIQLFICHLFGMEPFRTSIHSEVNDFRTLYVLALEILLTTLVIWGMNRKKNRSGKPAGN